MSEFPEEGVGTQPSVFLAELERVEQQAKVSEHAREYAKAAWTNYHLDDREAGLLAVEFQFFCVSPPDPELRSRYWRSYDDLAEDLFFAGGTGLTAKGWRFRWGADMHSLEQARRESLGGNFSFESVLAGTSANLAQVLFNIKHEQILDEHGLSLRELGRE